MIAFHSLEQSAYDELRLRVMRAVEGGADEVRIQRCQGNAMTLSQFQIGGVINR